MLKDQTESIQFYVLLVNIFQLETHIHTCNKWFFFQYICSVELLSTV